MLTFFPLSNLHHKAFIVMATWKSNSFNYAGVKRMLKQLLTPVIILAIALIFIFHQVSISKAQVNIPTKPIEVDLFVDGLNLLRPEAFLQQNLKNNGKTNLTIENRPSGLMTIKSVKQLPVTINVTQPDGSVKELPDPRAKFETDILITLSGKAQIQNTAPVIGESSLKIGSRAKIEGFNYDINATVVDLRIN